MVKQPTSPEPNPVEAIGDVIKDRIGNTLWETLDALEEAMGEELRPIYETAERVRSLVSNTSHAQGLELFAEYPLKLCCLRRVFFGVSLARHFQDPAQFSQPVIHSLQTQLHLVLRAEPRLDFLGPFSAARLQAGLELLPPLALHLGRKRVMVSVEGD